MRWKHNFQNSVLEQGKEFYQNKRVRNLNFEEDTYYAQVFGDKRYDVEVQVKEEKIVRLGCTCRSARMGKACAHMVAVLTAVDEQGEVLRKQQPKEPAFQPFVPITDHYQYFDVARWMKNCIISKKVYEDAALLIKKGMIILEKVEVGYGRFISGSCLRGIASGYYVNGTTRQSVEIIFEREEILRAVCSVTRCGCFFGSSYYQSGAKKVCKHVLAVLMLLDEYLKKYNPGDSTDVNALLLLDGFRSQHRKETALQQENVKNDLIVEPVVERNGDDIQLSFKAGVDKLFVVKDIPEFVELYETGDVISFGKKTEINLTNHQLQGQSKSTFEYMQSLVKDVQEQEEQRQKSHFYYTTEEIKNKISLYGERLDRFYDLYEGKTLNCNDRTKGKCEKTLVELKEGKPNLSIKIKKDMGEDQIFHGVLVSGKIPELLYGRAHRYYFRGNTFYRVNQAAFQEIEPLIEMGEEGAFQFQVGRKSLSEFYHQVLPVLKRSITVKEEEAELIQTYVPPEAVFVFYLDAENGRLICRPKARYGAQEVSLLDHLKKEAVFEDFREIYREQEILFQAQSLFEECNLERDELYCEEDETAMLRLLDGGVEHLMTIGEVHTTDHFRSMSIRRRPRFQVGVSLESDLLNLSVSSEELTPEELLQILQSYQKKKKYYRLKSGDLIEVEEADMEALQQMMTTLQLSPKEVLKGNMKVPVYRALYVNKMLEQSESIYLNRDKHFKNLIREFKTVDDSYFEVPKSLENVMRNYQVRGFQWLKTLAQYGFGGILADDMGLGKTLQMIAVLLEAKKRGESGTSLIVCPASLVYNWKEEFAKFAPEMNVTLIVGTQQERAERIQSYENSDVLVTSYDLLKRDIAEYEDKAFFYQVLDEAQYIKNHTTAAAKSVKIIHSKYRCALTGTPIENRLSELWSIFDYLMPGFLYSYEMFRKELETPIVKYKEESASQRLKKMVSPFILRRLKGDVLKDLPEKIEEIRYAKLEEKQQMLYDGQVVHMKEVIAQQGDDFQKNKLQILAELTKIRQICCDPELLFESYRGGSAKRDACVELIQSAIEGEHKCLVFSQFTSMLEILEKKLKEQGIAYYKIIGDTPKQKRVEMVNAFNEDATPVFLISLKAGGTGLNLTGADVVIHYDPWWNQAVQNQATDRAHRIGQTKVVSVYKLIAKNTIEEKIVKMQESKRDLADSVLNGEMGGISQMSKEELLELLG